MTLAAAARSAILATLPSRSPLWSRPLVFFLHLSQPIVRSWHRYWLRIQLKRTPRFAASQPRLADASTHPIVKSIGLHVLDFYWSSSNGAGREQFLSALERQARQDELKGDFHAEWHAHDAEFWPDPWHDVRVVTATEELGHGKRFTRARFSVRLTFLAKAILTVNALAGAYVSSIHWPLGLVALLPLIGVAGVLGISRLRCCQAITRLALRAGDQANFKGFAGG